MWYLSGEIKAVIPNKMLLTISHKKKKKKKKMSVPGFGMKEWLWMGIRWLHPSAEFI